MGFPRGSGMAKEAKSKIRIEPSEVGSLRRIAQRDGGMKRSGEISKAWARKKMKDPKTSGAVKKKLNFFLNFAK